VAAIRRLAASGAMNFRRGLFRLWVVLSTGWIIGIGWSSRIDCAFGGYSAPWCVGYGHDPYALESAIRVHAIVFGIPLLTLIVGLALIWAMTGSGGDQIRAITISAGALALATSL
jgi:hypothetical protein